jgi:uncharacterized protein (TIGR03000 family)
MNKSNAKRLLAAVLVVTALTALCSTANAWCGCSLYSSGSYTPYTTVGYSTVSSYGDWYLGVRPGPVRRLLLGPYRWYYDGYAGCCSYYGLSTVSYVSYSQPCGCLFVDGDTAFKTAAPTPAMEPTRAVKPSTEPAESSTPKAPNAILGPSPNEPTPPERNRSSFMPEPSIRFQPAIPAVENSSSIDNTIHTPENSGLLTMWVPYDAKVIINGMTTRTTGSKRQFVSYGLQPGFTYTYEIKAQIERNGRIVEEIRTVELTAGKREALAFGFNPKPDEELAVNP